MKINLSLFSLWWTSTVSAIQISNVWQRILGIKGGPMSQAPIDALFCWFSNHKQRLANTGIELEYSRLPEATGATLDLFSSSWVGRATVWETGECDCELLSEAGEQLLWKHYNGVEGDRLEPLLELLAHQISNQTLESAD
ncbi:MAG: hypothetical protein K1X53_09295 [Candidatus Sumerlaeaceae bacterium]|nr:hypothetical protein [Candidatus Sumerlaeaceae bacterium]